MKTHRRTRTPEWNAWSAMRYRCNVKSCPVYERYGGRGIYVCERWNSSFENFFADMGEKPNRYTLDRIDNDEPYSPENCRWATYKENLRNRRRSVGGFNTMLTIDGVTKCAAEWGERAAVSLNTFYKRLEIGWPPKDALCLPKDQGHRRVDRLALIVHSVCEASPEFRKPGGCTVTVEELP